MLRTSGTMAKTSAPTGVVITSTCAPVAANARIAGTEWTVSPRKPRSTTRTFFQSGKGMDEFRLKPVFGQSGNRALAKLSGWNKIPP